ncbi:MAG TPA: hypothetical protein VGZ47_18415 [Gemmataceae bacterium]|jgi:hypothetical protein|nr:hypothetical protein [Gemmataceae bacterium]
MPGKPGVPWTIAVTVLLAGPWLAATRADDDKIEITVLAILASEKNNSVDDRLKDVAKEIQKKEPALIGFKEERVTKKSIKIGDKATFPLVDEKEVVVILTERDPKDGRVTVTIKPPTVGDITYICCCGKFFPVITRYVTKADERLIVAVMVKPCHKK